MKQAKALARAAGLMLPLGLAAALAHANCGSAMCLLNTDWSTQGVWTEPGLRVDLRYEGVRQDRLRAGTKKVGPEAVSDEIVPLETRDGNWFVGSTTPSMRAGAWASRCPSCAASTGNCGAMTWPATACRTFRSTAPATCACSAATRPVEREPRSRRGGGGLDLRAQAAHRPRRHPDPNGERAEPGLQPGTGTTDLLLGAYWHRQLVDSRLSLFARVQWQRELDRKDDYRPGDKLSLDVGLRYPLTDRAGAAAAGQCADDGEERGRARRTREHRRHLAHAVAGFAFTITPTPSSTRSTTAVVPAGQRRTAIDQGRVRARDRHAVLRRAGAAFSRSARAKGTP